MRITSIQRRPRKRGYDVRVDHVLVVPLSAEVLAQASLVTGQEVTDSQLKTLEEAEARHSAMASALRLLGFRQRSQKEMREALGRRKIAADVLAETMARLQELRLLDDTQFAWSYVDARDRISPRSRRLLRAELVSRGIARMTAELPLDEIDEADAAYRAAVKRGRSLMKLPYADFQRRLGDHLLRRGFAYDTARATVRRLWGELHEDEAMDELD